MLKKNFFNSFLLVLGLLICIAFLGNYGKYYIAKDYLVTTYTACDPSKYSCFKIREDSEQFIFYVEPYAKVDTFAHDAPTCLNEHTCEDFICGETDKDCVLTYCSEESIEEWEICSSEVTENYGQ